eukprot:scaffold802_cov280-Pinguiococcus_pyrenoidosus.AAC.8
MAEEAAKRDFSSVSLERAKITFNGGQESWPLYARRVEKYLKGKGLSGVIGGTLEDPQAQAIVYSFILQTVERCPSARDQILSDAIADDPCEGTAAWTALKAWFDGGLDARDDLACDEYEALTDKRWRCMRVTRTSVANMGVARYVLRVTKL